MTTRVVLIRYRRDGRARRASGLHISGKFILTADHCANGTEHSVTVGGVEYSATPAGRSNSLEVDLAILFVADLAAVPPLPCARIDTSVSAQVGDCEALGFPEWKTPNGEPVIAHAPGYVPTAEGTNPTTGAAAGLSLKITAPQIRDIRLQAGDLDEQGSRWAGMSGAVVVASGSTVLGVVRSHSPAEGVGSLTFTPLSAIDKLDPYVAATMWSACGVHDPQSLPVLPPRAPAMAFASGEVIVVGEIPSAPAGFVEREIVARVESVLRQSPVAVVCALTGLRGIGKTHVAAACARSMIEAGGSGFVGWVNADTAATQATGLARIAIRLGIADPDGDSLESARRLREHLTTRPGPNLIVFDNAHDPNGLQAFLPAAGSTRVIITSTDRQFEELGVPIEVDQFTRDESIDYLHQRTGLDDEAGAAAVAEELGDLPLALASAATTIRARHYTYGQYVDRLQLQPIHKALPRADGQPYPQNTQKALLLALDTAGRIGAEELDGSQRRVVARLLPVISVLSSDGVGIYLLQRFASGDIDDQEAVDAAIQRFVRGSVLTYAVGGESVIMHRLMARVVREQLYADRKLAWVTNVALELLEPDLVGFYRHVSEPHLSSQAAFHVEALWHAIPIETLDPDTVRRLLVVRKYAVRQLVDVVADLTRAVQLGARVFADTERILGADDPDTLSAHYNLAYAYREAGRINDAIVTHERTLAARERILGPDHLDTLSSRNDLAFAYRLAGRIGQAVELFERTLADRERVLPQDHPQVLSSRNNLAYAYRVAGRLNDALTLHEETLRDREHVLGPDHPQTLESRNNLTVCYRMAGRITEAVDLFERTLRDRERVHGPDHPQTLIARYNLAFTLRAAGRIDEAIAMHERTLADRQRVLGPDHPQVLSSANQLGDCYRMAGRIDEAVAVLEQNRADRERILGPDHIDTLLTCVYLANAARAAGRAAAAVQTLEHTLTESTRILGLDHPQTLETSSVLGNAYLAAGRLEEAIPMLERTLTHSTRTLGADHPDTLKTRNYLGSAYFAAQRLDDAVLELSRALGDCERVLGTDHPTTVEVRKNLAIAYLKRAEDQT